MNSRTALGVFTVVVATMSLSVAACAATEQVLYTITNRNFAFPTSTLIWDPAGNLYGVSSGGVFEMSPSGSSIMVQMLHEIPPIAFPGGRLLRDSAGNLYGATWQGGAHNCGFVYQLSPSSQLPWNYKLLHQFDFTDGCGASFGLISDAAGNLYGVAHNGGPDNAGSAYELSPNADGSWTFSLLHLFRADEGGGPQTALIFDQAGNLFGGNTQGIFELSPNSDGTWTETTAYTFSGNDGGGPVGDFMFDSGGNLYGTNQSGGLYYGGTAFMLTPNGQGSWTSTVVHSFGRTKTDGYNPLGGLVADSSGNLYGTTAAGGGSNTGTVYELSPGTGGVWTETVLHRFGVIGSPQGNAPQGALVLDSAGNLYGTTAEGGDSACYPVGGGCGVVYRLLH